MVHKQTMNKIYSFLRIKKQLSLFSIHCNISSESRTYICLVFAFWFARLFFSKKENSPLFSYFFLVIIVI